MNKGVEPRAHFALRRGWIKDRGRRRFSLGEKIGEIHSSRMLRERRVLGEPEARSIGDERQMALENGTGIGTDFLRHDELVGEVYEARAAGSVTDTKL